MHTGQSGDDTHAGWRAIDRVLDQLYDGREPKHWGTIIRYSQGGPDPLDGISAYENDVPSPHWHLIGYGLSELYSKQEGTEPQISGFGYEFTMRVARQAGDDEPPYWAMNLMQNLARSVHDYGSNFGHLHTLNANGPIREGSPTLLSAVLFVLDSQLGEIDTPNGRLRFLELVGITADELRAKNAWDANGLLSVLSRDDPLLITDLFRASILDDPAIARLVDEGIARDGSSCAELRVSELVWVKALIGKSVTVSIGAAIVEAVIGLLRGRLRHARPFLLRGADVLVSVTSGGICEWSADARTLDLVVSPAAVDEMIRELKPRRGTYRFHTFPGLLVQVMPTEIRDSKGNIAEIIG